MSELPILVGGLVRLRPPIAADIDARLALGRDAKIAKMFGVSEQDVSPLTRLEAQGWFQALCDHHHAWVIESAQSFIGEIRLDRVDFQDRRASMAVGIFDRASLGRGLGSEAIRLVLRYAFGAMKLHRLGIRVLAYNKRAIRAYQKCGFVVEGRERETAFVNGAWHDDIMMGLLEHEFQALEA